MENAAAEGRKRKFAFGELELPTSSVQLKTRRLEAAPEPDDSSLHPVSAGNSTCESVSSRCDVLASCCSSTESLKFVDLERENFAASAVNSDNFRDSCVRSSYIVRRENTPSIDASDAAEDKLLATAALRASNNRHCSTAEKMASEAEVEEFFAAAENDLQKQFINKYNFDIVKDEPTEGRFEWVKAQVKP